MISIKTTLKGPLWRNEMLNIARQELRGGITRAVAWGEMRVKEKTPVGVTGFLRAGVTGRVVTPVRGVIGEQGPAKTYVEVVEKGRKPNKRFPPPGAIEIWLRRTDKGRAFVKAIKDKYRIRKEQTALRSATFLKSRAIARQGTKKIQMFKTTERKERNKFNQFIREAVKRIERRLK